eukprot:TRINITY_DN59269_c0_g1_i1.p1 TRINITY_DN59269_c0_g1~~TRINITY_DN59269_c0_g1_i1.p1  ORF type:complete len:132 (-),score=39.14 TRINITY_DN59269_c0_g1_i1:139-534(-)
MADEEDSKKGYDVPLIRLQDSRSKLDTDDLDDEERKVLAEVSKKGYYHARPKTETAPPPQRIENPEALQWGKGSDNVKKRSTFDKYQQKWDRFEKHEPIVKEAVPKATTPPTTTGLLGWFKRFSVCCKRRK